MSSLEMMTERINTFFKIPERKSTIWTEVRAGTATFMTLCYILAVNARLIGDSGGPCKGDIFSSDYAQCQEDFRRQMVTVTALSSFIACMLMGVGANLPFALAPGMGLNAYFTYDVVGWRGTGKVAWDVALTAIFFEGIVFCILTLSGFRMKFAKILPEPVKLATTGGIGLFLAHLGLQTAEGIGLVVTDIATGLTLGGCPPDKRSYALYNAPGAVWGFPTGNNTFGVGGVIADSYTCDNLGGKMTSATTWLGIFTLFLCSYLLKHKVKGALIIGIAGATLLSWIKGTPFSYFDDDVYPLGGTNPEDFNGGEYRWNFFKDIVGVQGMDMTFFKFSFDWDNAGDIFVAFLTFFYVDFFDTTGTLFAMAEFAGMTKEDGSFENDTKAFMVDGVATSIGACLGSSPVTTYIESAPGLEEGGRTGLTAVVVAMYFLISIFFAPLLASIPPWATGPALIIVGCMMMRGVTKIDWNDYAAAVPAFVTMILMPLTYSIAYGIIGGLMTWVVLNVPDMMIARYRGENQAVKSQVEFSSSA